MRFFSIAIAIVTGFLVLLGYFLPIPALQMVRQVLLQWAVIVAAFALLVGIANLVGAHITRLRRGRKGSGYSLVLVMTLAVTVILTPIFAGPTGPFASWMFSYIQFPIEGSLMALLAILLVYASVRMFTHRPTGHVVVFLAVALFVLLTTTPLFVLGEIQPLITLRTWVIQVLAVGGARGILLGVALGTIATGLRVLMGADRPYGG